MRVDTNLSSMLAVQMQVNVISQNIAQVANIIGDSQFQEATSDIISSNINQTSQIISYSSNKDGISTQLELLNSTINIKV